MKGKSIEHQAARRKSEENTNTHRRRRLAPQKESPPHFRACKPFAT